METQKLKKQFCIHKLNFIMKFQNLEFNYRDSVVNDELYIIFIF